MKIPENCLWNEKKNKKKVSSTHTHKISHNFKCLLFKINDNEKSCLCYHLTLINVTLEWPFFWLHYSINLNIETFYLLKFNARNVEIIHVGIL